MKDKIRLISVRLDETTARQFRSVLSLQGVTAQKMLEEAIRAFIAKDNSQRR